MSKRCKHIASLDVSNQVNAPSVAVTMPVYTLEAFIREIKLLPSRAHCQVHVMLGDGRSRTFWNKEEAIEWVEKIREKSVDKAEKV